MAMKKPGAYAPLSAYYADDDRIMEAGEDAELLYVRMLAYAARSPEREGWVSDAVVSSRLGILERDSGNGAGNVPGNSTDSRKQRSRTRTDHSDEVGKSAHDDVNDAPGDVVDEFADWWKLYPKKVDKGHAKKAFAKARKSVELVDLCAATEALAEKAKHMERRFIPNPATWLNGERWTDEPDVPTDPDDPPWRPVGDPPEGMFNYDHEDLP